jgi:hypothetical protein
LAVLGGVLIGILGVGALAAASLDSGRSQNATAADAMASVRDLVGPVGALTVTGTIETAYSRAFRVEGLNLEAAVDMATGEIGYVTLFDKVPRVAGANISVARAKAAAAALLTRRGVSAPNSDGTVSLDKHGTSWEYRVTWAKRVNAAMVPDQLTVLVNPMTGDWYSLVRIERPYVDPSAPAVTVDEATALGLKSIAAGARLEAFDLQVVFLANGQQRLAWSLQFVTGDPDGYEAGQNVLIDAMTGSVIELKDL